MTEQACTAPDCRLPARPGLATCSPRCAARLGRARRAELRESPAHRCALPGCDEEVVRRAGETPSAYRRRRYHSDAHSDAGRSRTVSALRTAAPLPERPCGCGCGMFSPRSRSQRFATRSCALRIRNGTGPRETKVCACPCRTAFERPVGISTQDWQRRRFVDGEHRRRGVRPDVAHPMAVGQPGAARAGRRSAPRLTPSANRPKSTPAPTAPVVTASVREAWRPANIGRDVRPRLPARAH